MTDEKWVDRSKPLLRVCLCLTGAFDPSAFNEAVGLPADWIKRRGERDSEAGYEDCIASAARAQSINVELSVVAWWYPQESTSPAVHLSAEQLARLFRLGAHLDVDLYPYPDEAEDDAP